MARTPNKDYPLKPWNISGPRVYAWQTHDLNGAGPHLARKMGLPKPPSQADLFDRAISALYRELEVERPPRPPKRAE